MDEIGNVSDVHSFHENGLDGDFDKCLPMLMKDTIEMHAITYKSEIFRRFEYHQTEGIKLYRSRMDVYANGSSKYNRGFPKDCV